MKIKILLTLIFVVNIFINIMRISLFTLFTLIILIHSLISDGIKGKGVKTSSSSIIVTKIKAKSYESVDTRVKADVKPKEKSSTKSSSPTKAFGNKANSSDTGKVQSKNMDRKTLNKSPSKSIRLYSSLTKDQNDQELQSEQEDLNSEDMEDSTNDNSEDDDCGPNEKFTNCGNKCKESLEHIKRGKVCPSDCQRGCFCVQGYFRDGFRNCNLAEDKDIENLIGGETKKSKKNPCKRPNEIYDDCGDRCVESIINISNYTLCKPHQCLRGCYCVDGYMRQGDINGVCVPAIKPKLEDDVDEEGDDSDISKIQANV